MNPLENLRDIITPEAGGWWPPAIGWWLVLACFIGALAWVTQIVVRYWQRQRPRREVIRNLKQLDLKVDSTHYARMITLMLQLVRRFAIVEFGQQKVSSLQGDQWLNFLTQRSSDPDVFQNTPLAQIITWPYRRHGAGQPALPDIDANEGEEWIDLEHIRNALVKWCRHAKKPTRCAQHEEQ